MNQASNWSFSQATDQRTWKKEIRKI